MDVTWYLWLVLSLYKEAYKQIIKFFYWLHGFCGKWKGSAHVNQFNPTDRPKSVSNRCVIEVFWGFFMLSILF